MEKSMQQMQYTEQTADVLGTTLAKVLVKDKIHCLCNKVLAPMWNQDDNNII